MRGNSYTFLTRRGCHLCDRARPLVEREVERAGRSLVEVDVDTDDRLVRDYGLRIPVLLDPEGRVVAEGVIEDRRRLRAALAQPR